MHVNFGDALFLGSLQNRVCKWAFQQARQNRNDIETHVQMCKFQISNVQMKKRNGCIEAFALKKPSSKRPKLYPLCR